MEHLIMIWMPPYETIYSALIHVFSAFNLKACTENDSTVKHINQDTNLMGQQKKSIKSR